MLSGTNQFREAGNVNQPCLLGWRIGLVQTSRQNELQSLCCHFIGLVRGDCCFQSQQMLVINPVCFSKNLPPAILAGRFHARHGQFQRVESRVMVFGHARKQKIRLGLVLCYGCSRIAEAVFRKQHFQMVFQSKADTTFAPILHRQGEGQEAININRPGAGLAGESL